MKNSIQELFDIDRKFCEEAQINGYKSWEKYLSDQIIFGGEPKGPYEVNRERIIESMKNFYTLEDLHFVWQPLHAFISDDGTLGVTTGTYERTYIYNNLPIRQTGKYTTTWKKIDSVWKIIFDFGN